MKQCKIVSFLQLLIALLALAAPPEASASVIGRFMKAQGKIRILRRNESIEPKDREEVRWNDEITGETGALGHLWFPRQEVILSGPFRIIIEKSSGYLDLTVIQLKEGQIRMKTRNLENDRKTVNILRSTTGTVSLAGATDFYAGFNPLFQETEILSFDRPVTLRSLLEESSKSAEIGQWIGVGGRFGNLVRPPLAFDGVVLSHFRKILPFPEP